MWQSEDSSHITIVTFLSKYSSALFIRWVHELIPKHLWNNQVWQLRLLMQMSKIILRYISSVIIKIWLHPRWSWFVLLYFKLGFRLLWQYDKMPFQNTCLYAYTLPIPVTECVKMSFSKFEKKLPTAWTQSPSHLIPGLEAFTPWL